MTNELSSMERAIRASGDDLVAKVEAADRARRAEFAGADRQREERSADRIKQPVEAQSGREQLGRRLEKQAEDYNRFRIGGGVIGIGFNASGTQFLVATDSSIIYVFDTGSGKAIRQFQFEGGGDRAVFSRDGKLAWVTSRVYPNAWDVQTGTIVATLRDSLGGHDFAIMPDGSLLATDGRNLSLWSLKDGRKTREATAFSGKLDYMYRCCLAQDGGLALITGSDYHVTLVDVNSGREIYQVPPHPSLIDSVTAGLAISPDGRVAILESQASRTWFVWDLNEHKMIRQVRGENRSVTSAAFSLDGRLAVLGCDVDDAGLTGITKCALRVYDARDWHLIRSIRFPSGGGINDVVFSPNGKRIGVAARWGLAKTLSIE